MNAQRLPVWASLARDYLPIMASSVSSERAFSSAGITISKRRNRLKADVVEALQFLKCAIRRDLLYREPAPCSAIELELLKEEEVAEKEDEEIRMEDEKLKSKEPLPWDSFLSDDEGDDAMEID